MLSRHKKRKPNFSKVLNILKLVVNKKVTQDSNILQPKNKNFCGPNKCIASDAESTNFKIFVAHKESFLTACHVSHLRNVIHNVSG